MKSEKVAKGDLVLEVRFVDNFALELFIAMRMVANRERHQEMLMQLDIAPDELYFSMLDDMRQKLTPFQRRELQFFFGTERGTDPFGIELVALDPEAKTENLQDIVEQFQTMSYDSLVRTMVNSVADESLRMRLFEACGTGILEVQDVVCKMLDDFRHVEQPPQSLQRLLETSTDCEEAKQRLCRLAVAFYSRAFLPHEKDIVEGCRVHREFHKQALLENQCEYFKEFVKADQSIFSAQVKINVSYMLHVGIHTILYESGPDWVVLGAETKHFLSSEFDRETAERVFKAVADKNRFDIIRRLRVRPWYGQELAQALGMTPAAVTYHMNFLFALGVVTTERKDHRYYYILDKSKFEVLLDDSKRALLQ